MPEYEIVVPGDKRVYFHYLVVANDANAALAQLEADLNNETIEREYIEYAEPYPADFDFESDWDVTEKTEGASEAWGGEEDGY